MKKATSLELHDIVWHNKDLFGSLNHVQKTRQELLFELFEMPECILHYAIFGDCLMIFSKPSQQ